MTSENARRLEGAWQTVTYVMKGRPTPVEGVLLLADGHWATLYFVPGAGGPWGSAESGLFEFDGDQLTFHHRQVFQGGGGRPLEIDRSADRVEICGAALGEKSLEITFPSGNSLHLQRPA